jgi:hypothetical protein
MDDTLVQVLKSYQHELPDVLEKLQTSEYQDFRLVMTVSRPLLVHRTAAVSGEDYVLIDVTDCVISSTQ